MKRPLPKSLPEQEISIQMFSLVQPSRHPKHANWKSGHGVTCCWTDTTNWLKTDYRLLVSLAPAFCCCQRWSNYGFCQQVFPLAWLKCWKWHVAWPGQLLPNPVPFCQLKLKRSHKFCLISGFSCYSLLLLFLQITYKNTTLNLSNSLFPWYVQRYSLW